MIRGSIWISVLAPVGPAILWFEFPASAKGGHTKLSHCDPTWGRRRKGEACKLSPNIKNGIRPFIITGSLPLAVANSI